MTESGENHLSSFCPDSARPATLLSYGEDGQLQLKKPVLAERIMDGYLLIDPATGSGIKLGRNERLSGITPDPNDAIAEALLVAGRKS